MVETAAWIGLWLKQKSSENEAKIVLATLLNYFKVLLPLSENIYDDIQGDIVSVGGLNDENGEIIIQSKKMVIIYFLSKKNLLKELENNLPPSILITRTIRNLNVDINIKQSSESIFNHSKAYVDFERRIFGPQEVRKFSSFL